MMNRFAFFSAFLLIMCLLSSPMSAADISLPAPQTEGGMGLFEALKKRSSTPGGDFSPAEIKLEDLSTVLWAATGLNRGQKGWTVPMSKGLPPYCRIYVAGSDGIWRYDWVTNSLKEVSTENIKAKIASQSFVRRANYILIIVSDAEILAEFNNEKDASEFAQVAAGAMTQNIYLAAAALKLGTRYIHSIDHEAIKTALKLPEGDVPICLMLLGK